MFPGAGWQGRAGETWGKEMGSACTSEHSHTWVHQRPWKESPPGFEPAPTYCVPLTALSLHFLNYKLEIKPVVLTRCLGVEHRKLAQEPGRSAFPPRAQRAGRQCVRRAAPLWEDGGSTAGSRCRRPVQNGEN